MKRISDYYFLNRYLFFIVFLLIILMIVIMTDSIGLIAFLKGYYPIMGILFFFLLVYIIFFGTLDFYNQAFVEIDSKEKLIIKKGTKIFVLENSDVEKIYIRKIINYRSDLIRYKIRIKTFRYGDVCFLCNEKNLSERNYGHGLWNNYSWDKVFYLN